MNRLKELRKEKGFTQVKIQMLTGIDQSDYSKIESLIKRLEEENFQISTPSLRIESITYESLKLLKEHAQKYLDN